MATVAERVKPVRAPLSADLLEKALAGLSVVLLCFALAAVMRGQADWAKVPPVVWLHLATVLTALAITPVMLLRRRGDRTHRQLGWIWASAMLGTALISFGIRYNQHGGFSWIHGLSVMVSVAVPWLVLSARRHDVTRHRRTARALVMGALLTAGFFTFPFERLLGRWLFG